MFAKNQSVTSDVGNSAQKLNKRYLGRRKNSLKKLNYKSSAFLPSTLSKNSINLNSDMSKQSLRVKRSL